MPNVIPFEKNYTERVRQLDAFFRTDENFDVVAREIKIASHSAKLYFIDGFAKDEVLEKVLEFIMKLTDKDVNSVSETREFANKFLPYIEVDVHSDLVPFSTFVYSGAIGMIVDGFGGGMLVDARTYPSRSIEEPDNDKVLRGSHEGFVETMIFNTSLIRRRIRDRNLTMEIHQVGERSHTDVVLCYMKDKVDTELLATIQRKLRNIDVNSLAMGQESLSECLIKKQWFNPFPKVRYTERPDTAAACVYEGDIIILTDNSPSAMIVPTGFMAFLQDTNDFYFAPVVGTFLRLVRAIIFALAMFLTPVWYLFESNPEIAPKWFELFAVKQPSQIPLLVQLLLIELVIDALKLASLNTPNSLSNSLSIIGALVLSELAVSAGLFSTEAVLFMAFVAIANFAQPSLELGYAFKLSRVFILILTGLFNLWGFITGVITVILLIAFTNTNMGKGYLYPVRPFNGKSFISLLIRKPISKENT